MPDDPTPRRTAPGRSTPWPWATCRAEYAWVLETAQAQAMARGD